MSGYERRAEEDKRRTLGRDPPPLELNEEPDEPGDIGPDLQQLDSSTATPTAGNDWNCSER